MKFGTTRCSGTLPTLAGHRALYPKSLVLYLEEEEKKFEC